MEKSRVRLSSIDLLPPEAEADVAWAIAEIEEGKRLQIDIHQEFNARLADRGIGPVSHSAFSRYSLRKRRAFARLREVREISASISKAIGPGDDDALMTAIAQMMKTRIYELLENDKGVDPKSVKELGQGVQSLVSAQRMSAEIRRRLEETLKQRIGKAVDAVEGEMAKSGDKTDGAEVLRRIREDVYGVFER